MFLTKNLYQNDDAWAKTPLGNSSETIGGWGCLLTSVTMMLNGIGYNETPLTVNEKMKAAGGFRGALFIPSVLPYVWPQSAYSDMQPCESSPAPLAQIDAAVAAGKPVILQVDWNKQQGIQTHFVLVKERKGDDYSLYDPYKYGGDAPGKDVLLTTRYKYNGATLLTEISAVLWFNSYGTVQPEAPKVVKVPVPADKFMLYASVDDLALRAEASVNGYLWKRMLQNTELICLEDKAKAKAKIGVQGQWIQVQDPKGDQGYVAAWYVSDVKAKPAVSSSTSASSSTPKPVPTAAPVPPGAIALYPTVEISFRAQPSTSGAVLRHIPVTEQLISLEAANVTIPKVGVQGQWIKVRGADKQEGYVAAWYVKYAGGASAPAANKSGKVHTTVEQVSLRSQPVVNETTLIKRVPINYEFTITEPGGESKVGANDKWIKVKDAVNEGYVAAWFLTF
jgi:hypothetical protein